MGKRVFGTLVSLFLTTLLAGATPLPLTAKDISLMLRSGYTSNAVLQDLAIRHFADSIDSSTESMLVQAGASPELIEALKSGAYSVSSEEMATVRAARDAQDRNRAVQAEQSRRMEKSYESRLARERTPANLPESDAIAKFLKGDLVQYRNGSVVHADDEAFFKKKLIAFYFSAFWCVPCRKFTPQLVEYYNRVAAQHPEFEIVFFSLDKTAAAMEGYMGEANMPWLAIDYQKLKNKEILRKNVGDSIPSLVLVDGTGRVLSSSFTGKEYLGPQKVLADLDTIFGQGKVALTR